jgi:type I site-specific restriction endonuclease
MELNNDDSFEYSLDIKTINSHNSKSENEHNKKADVIVTTVQSLGTGSDIKGVTDIICCSPMVSKIVVKQVIGRIRYINKKCHYFDIVDMSVPADIYWWKSRSRTLKSLAMKYEHRAWAFEGDE